MILRRRRQELNLHLANIAQALDVTPEAISMWERGRRRMDLDKLPTIAQVLRLQQSDFCLMAIYHFHPAVYTAVFGQKTPSLPRPVM